MNPHADRDVSAALVSALTTFAAGLPSAPGVYFTRPDRGTTARPYLVVEPLGQSGSGGSLSDQTDAVSLYQVMVVSEMAVQAEALADDVRAFLVMRTLTITGRSCEAIQWDSSQPITPDEDVQPPLFYGTASYRIATTSA